MRATSGDAAQSEIRKRKGRTASPPPRKQDAETL
jgi:hypothetical protein